ncbi:PPE family protein [Mycolicibacillus parakoreensis]|nr:PPE family protein [Mycolicibacillus parakoreensis]
MIDFAIVPPEITSARMYAGPGSGPLLTASAAWDALGAAMQSALVSYSTAVSALAAEWQGPSSVAMASSAARFLQWVSTTAAQVEQTGIQAKAAAAAFETAFAATVPPPVIAANRSLLVSLVATNFLGQNTPAIMATEAHYLEMWAQDAAAMVGYAGASAAATAAVTPFSPPQQNTNPAGVAGQTGAVAQSEGSSVAGNVQAALANLGSSGLQAGSPSEVISNASGLMSPASNGGSLLSSVASLGMSSGSMSPATQSAGSVTDGGTLALLPGASGLGSLPGVAGSAGSTGAGASGVTAGLGRAVPIGGLSAPATWGTTTPAVSSPTATLTSASGAAAKAGPGGTLGGVPLAGSGIGARGNAEVAPRFGFRPEPHPVMPRTAAGG